VVRRCDSDSFDQRDDLVRAEQPEAAASLRRSPAQAEEGHGRLVAGHVHRPSPVDELLTSAPRDVVVKVDWSSRSLRVDRDQN